MYNYKNEELDEKIIKVIDNFFDESKTEMIVLSDIGQLIKMEIRNDIDLTYNNKVRNITSYIRNNHKSLSKFITPELFILIGNGPAVIQLGLSLNNLAIFPA